MSSLLIDSVGTYYIHYTCPTNNDVDNIVSACGCFCYCQNTLNVICFYFSLAKYEATIAAIGEASKAVAQTEHAHISPIQRVKSY